MAHILRVLPIAAILVACNGPIERDDSIPRLPGRMVVDTFRVIASVGAANFYLVYHLEAASGTVFIDSIRVNSTTIVSTAVGPPFPLVPINELQRFQAALPIPQSVQIGDSVSVSYWILCSFQYGTDSTHVVRISNSVTTVIQ